VVKVNELAVVNTGLQSFSYEGKPVRTVQKDGVTWWVLRDVCDVLGLVDTHKVADRLDEDERNQIPVMDNLGRYQETTTVTESGLYNVILRSDKPEAKKFKRWVTHEVLPAIRKHGLYAVDEVLANPDVLIKALQELKAEREAHRNTATLLEEKTLQLDESKEWLTVKRVAVLNNKHWKAFNWKRLKNTSHYLGYPVKQVFDANYGRVNAYHIDVWRHEYSGCRYA
jgi:prophage antirepressor-like protein